MLQGTIRRSVTIPSSLDNKISLMAEEYNYKVKNDMIIELLEDGILKFSEDRELKELLYKLLSKLTVFINHLENQ